MTNGPSNGIGGYEATVLRAVALNRNHDLSQPNDLKKGRSGGV